MVFDVDRAERRKKIPGYGGRYEVGDLGYVYSGVFRMSLIGGRYVKLCRDGAAERLDVAYLVARAFLPNVEGRPYVVHRDGDVRNNRVENLEWSESRQRRRGGKRGEVRRPVLQYDRDGVFVASYSDVRSASEGSGVARYLIANCLAGRTRRAKGFMFIYG